MVAPATTAGGSGGPRGGGRGEGTGPRLTPGDGGKREPSGGRKAGGPKSKRWPFLWPNKLGAGGRFSRRGVSRGGCRGEEVWAHGGGPQTSGSHPKIQNL